MGIDWKMGENEPRWRQGHPHPPPFPMCVHQFLIFFFDSFTIIFLIPPACVLCSLYCIFYRQVFFFFEDADVAIQPLHSDNDALRASTWPTVPTWPHNPSHDEDNMHTACASNDNDTPKHPMAPTRPQDAPPAHDNRHCSLNIIL